MSQKDYDEMRDEQEGRCQICEKEIEALVVDHNHDSGAVRGLLCSQHNKMLGAANESILYLAKAIQYLAVNGDYCKPEDNPDPEAVAELVDAVHSILK